VSALHMLGDRDHILEEDTAWLSATSTWARPRICNEWTNGKKRDFLAACSPHALDTCMALEFRAGQVSVARRGLEHKWYRNSRNYNVSVSHQEYPGSQLLPLHCDSG
jgi:hypothetical protein